MLSGEGPIFLQLAQRVAEDIINGTYAEHAGIPSTNDFATFYTISPITSAKEQHVAPLLHEASLLGITSDELADMIKEKDQS